MNEVPPHPENPDIVALRDEIGKLSRKLDVLEQKMETQKAQLQGDIRELKAGTQTDIDHLKWQVRGVIFAFLVAVGAAVIGRLLGYI